MNNTKTLNKIEDSLAQLRAVKGDDYVSVVVLGLKMAAALQVLNNHLKQKEWMMVGDVMSEMMACCCHHAHFKAEDIMHDVDKILGVHYP